MADNDWRTMAPGPELDRLIAEKTGWKVVNDPYTSPSRNVYPYRLVMPDGGQFSYYKTIDEAWEHLPVGYSTDLNAALTLLDTLPDNWAWALHRRGYLPRLYIVEINDPAYRPENFDTVNADTLDKLPYQICRLWLAWHEKNPPTERTFGSAPGIWMADDFDDSGYE